MVTRRNTRSVGPVHEPPSVSTEDNVERGAKTTPQTAFHVSYIQPKTRNIIPEVT